jgi:putative NADH-flavin reductase
VKVLVFGATGATGRELVEQAMGRQHHVTAFARSSPGFEARSPQLTVARGTVTDTAAVEGAVAGQDAVLCALGSTTPLRRDPTLVEGVSNIVSAMQRHDVRRLVYLSFLGVRAGRWQLSQLGRWVVAPLLMRNVVADHEAKERIIQRRDIEWVIVRPPRLTNGPRTGAYRSGAHIAATSAVPVISRADLAEFMLDQVSDDTYLRATPAVMY